jgi:hypothetical protein
VAGEVAEVWLKRTLKRRSAIEQERLRKLAVTPAAENGSHAMVRLIARVLGVGIETADMLVTEVLSRAGRLAHVAGRIPKFAHAEPSSPQFGLVAT